jgi:RNA recognition motif-containing protein
MNFISLPKAAQGSNIPDGTLFIGDLSIFCTEEIIEEIFAPYGKIIYTTIMKCSNTNKSLCYGFLKFASWQDAVRAKDDLNGQVICGRAIR